MATYSVEQIQTNKKADFGDFLRQFKESANKINEAVTALKRVDSAKKGAAYILLNGYDRKMPNGINYSTKIKEIEELVAKLDAIDNDLIKMGTLFQSYLDAQ